MSYEVDHRLDGLMDCTDLTTSEDDSEPQGQRDMKPAEKNSLATILHHRAIGSNHIITPGFNPVITNDDTL